MIPTRWFLAALLPLIFCAGCSWPSTQLRINKDPSTGQVVVDFQRGPFEGPVSIDMHYTAPDGTKLDGTWSSNPTLDAWQSIAALQQANIASALQVAAEASKAAAAAGGAP